MTAPLDVHAGACLRFPRAGLPPRFEEQLRLSFTYENPDVLPKSKARTEDAEQWTAPKWSALRERGPYYLLPRGLLDPFRRIASSCGVPLKFTSRAVNFNTPRVPLEDFALEPRPYQREIIGLLVGKVQGYVVLPCGGGKTTTGALAALHVNQATLVLVHTVDLQRQWAATFKRALAGDGSRIRLIGGDGDTDLRPLRPGEIAIALVQSLYEHPDAGPFLRSVAVLLADECHHIVARQWRWVTDLCPARWRWGLTATPERGDGWGFMLEVLLGPKLYQLSALQLIEWGFLVRPTIVPVLSAWSPSPSDFRWILTCPTCEAESDPVGWKAWHAGEAMCKAVRVRTGPRGGTVREKCGTQLGPDVKAERGRLDSAVSMSALSMDATRTALLVQLATAAYERGRLTLVLMGRKAALDGVVAGVRNRGARVEAVSSGAAGRESKIAALRRGFIDALVATQLADEGLDVPALDCVIVGNPGRDKGRAQQRAGRAARPEGLPPVIFDVVDAAPQFHAQWRARSKAYAEAYGRECLASLNPLPVEKAIPWLDRVVEQQQAEQARRRA